MYNVDVKFINSNELRQQFTGSVLYLYFELLETLKPFFQRRLGSPDIRDVSGGESVFNEYPDTALVEALVNFLIHRDYSLADVGYITINPDRIEFMNPGQSVFPPSILLESSLPIRPLYKRNLRLITAMNRARLNQKEGSGILRIRQSLEENHSYFPDGSLGISIENNENDRRFTLTIFNRAYLSSNTVVENLPNLIPLSNNNLNETNQSVNIDSPKIIYESPAMSNVISLINKVAPTDSTVLITGETGTGKELVAQAIHTLSPRSKNPFIIINCAALNENLLESELFGFEKGAFSGAYSQRRGRVEHAEGGTLILDEINSLSGSLQSKLLNFLQTREFSRVGGSKIIRANVRIIACTNSNLEELVKNGSFLQSLYFRLNVVRIKIPPLKERKKDITILIDYFLDKYSKRINKNVQMDPKVYKYLLSYEFPGNVRELENIIERAVILCTDEYIRINDLPTELLK